MANFRNPSKIGYPSANQIFYRHTIGQTKYQPYAHNGTQLLVPITASDEFRLDEQKRSGYNEPDEETSVERNIR